MNEKESTLSLLLLDILRGYSKIRYKSKTYFFKHFTVYESLQLVEYELDSFDSAVLKGIKSEGQLIDLAIKRDVWSQSEESNIKNLRWMIEKSEKASSKIVDDIARKSFEDSISKQKSELDELESRRNSLVAHSAESLARRKRSYKEIGNNLFKDESMSESVDQDDLFFIMPMINEQIDKFTNVDNLLKIAYNPMFFDTYCIMYRQPNNIIKNDIFNISIWQKNLLFYSSVLLNKLKSYEVPDDVREDPLKLYKYTPREDGGPENKVTHGVSDLRAKMAEKGGKLTAEDF